MTHFTSLVIGDGSLLIQCAERLLARGNSVSCVVTGNAEITDWAKSHGLRVEPTGADLAQRLSGVNVDWLLSISNLSLISDDVLAKATNGAINFHDGPLPRYAGLNAPLWAIINQEKEHGVSWHFIDGGIDEGDILEQRLFELSDNDTALTVNTKCYAAAIDSFDGVLDQLESGTINRTPQDLSKRNYCAGTDRPYGAAHLDFELPTHEIMALIRALDHGTYRNPLACPKIRIDDEVLMVGSAEVVQTSQDADYGTVLSSDVDSITVATKDGAIKLLSIRNLQGKEIELKVKEGDVISSLSVQQAKEISDRLASCVKHENYWTKRLTEIKAVELPLASQSKEATDYARKQIDASISLALIGAFIARLTKQSVVDIALAATEDEYLNPWVPVRFEDKNKNVSNAINNFEETIESARKRGSFARDLLLRDPDISTLSLNVGLTNVGKPLSGTALTFDNSNGLSVYFDTNRIASDAVDLLIARLKFFAAAALDSNEPVSNLPILPDDERKQILEEWNDTSRTMDALCVHEYFEAQVLKTPDATAVVFENESLTYEALNARANRVAHVLQEMGVRPETLVGLCMDRSMDMLVGALAIQKAGGAYVPLDPTYPVDRLQHYLNDSKAPVVLTRIANKETLPPHGAKVLVIDADSRIENADGANLNSGVSARNIAYMIYTSGSTGVPKGVMVEHRNVANFFTGMDERILQNEKGVWLAVTSLSFDISVLELFYTLARGFKLVISGDESRSLVSSGRIQATDRGMEFSLFYWGNDDGPGPQKYKMLLDGARFADENGFCAVWTPERHFHAFGGPYPNPAITGAAVAAVTNNIGVRSGSCVAPLHHPARIAEEWAVIDNLTNGRVGLGIAAGWQPDDFVLRPENTPPNNKTAMYETIDILRKLWAGEAVEFPRQDGSMHAVVTQPRPVSKKLPIWITTAGNPATWIEAGELGANVLTHLLGQSVEEVGGKIRLYHESLRKAGYDPQDYTVTLMLHSYVAGDRETAREIARGPMKDYLRSAAGLIKQSAWDFPAFKRPKGVKNSFELNLDLVDAEELEAILEFAFERYFEDSGLFGTVEDCLDRVEQLKRIGVDEVACLIDYGIDSKTVLEGLVPLAKVLKLANTVAEIAPDDFSIAAQIIRHKVTHMQSTPSMARMFAMDDEAGHALNRLDQLIIGGEALPGTLVGDLSALTRAPIENMYGPTETTIWSSTETALPTDGLVNIGRPIANTQMYILDDELNPVPIGSVGELYIGGNGVTRGYWQRPELTEERFVDNPFKPETKMYRTGDLARWQVGGKIDFLGRTDHQIKLRGYRIETGEIEAALEAIGSIQQAVVIAREDVPGDTRLVAYIRGDGEINDKELRETLVRTLPDFMVPAHFVQVDQFPLTPNKKIDRNALPAPVAKTATTQEYITPSEGSDIQLATIWSQILGVNTIGARDNFFDLGGHSLLAVQAHREIKKTMGITKLSITDIFRFPVLADLSERIEKLSGNIETQNVIAPEKPAEKMQTRKTVMSKRRAMRAARPQRDM